MINSRSVKRSLDVVPHPFTTLPIPLTLFLSLKSLNAPNERQCFGNSIQTAVISGPEVRCRTDEEIAECL